MMIVLQKHSQRGVGLIEVLVTVVVLSVGLLGIASMQTHAIKNNNSALERSMAVIQSYSIADAMRVARTAAIDGEFDLDLDEQPGTGSVGNVYKSAPVEGSGSSQSFAQAALSDWRSSLKALLGDSATGSVACAEAVCTIVVQWDDSRATAGDETQQLQVEVYL
jgi:type IV pilus assembly protein PilV